MTHDEMPMERYDRVYAITANAIIQNAFQPEVTDHYTVVDLLRDKDGNYVVVWSKKFVFEAKE